VNLKPKTCTCQTGGGKVREKSTRGKLQRREKERGGKVRKNIFERSSSLKKLRRNQNEKLEEERSQRNTERRKKQYEPRKPKDAWGVKKKPFGVMIADLKGSQASKVVP